MAKKQSSRGRLLLIIGILLVSIATIIGILNVGRSLDYYPNQLVLWLRSTLNAQQNILDGSAEEKSQVIYKFAVLSDSHEDLTVYPQIVDQIAKVKDWAFVAHLGDLSNAGEIGKLQESKEILDRIEAPVYVLPGDHDLNWVPEHDLTNFRDVFGLNRTSYSFSYQRQRFIFIDNSDSMSGINQADWQWLVQDLEQNRHSDIYIFMSTPLSNPYLNFKAMGAQSEKVKQQGKELGKLLSQYDIKAIFAGDTHTFSQYKDMDSGLPIVTVGAAGTNKNPLPMYVEVEILSDGGYNVSSKPLSTKAKK